MQLENRDVDWFTQELRVASPTGEMFDYVTGLYYYFADNHDHSGDHRTLSNSPYAVDYNLANNTVENTNAAIFGQINIHPNERWTVFLGLRYLYDKVAAKLTREANTHNNAFLGDGALISTRNVDGINNSGSDTALIGNAGIEYQLSDDISAYFRYDRGYKGAAFNTSFKFSPEVFLDEEPVAPERSEALKLGLRTMWLEQQLMLNATLFYSRFDDLQLTVRDLENNRNILGSVPGAISQGVEIDFATHLSERFRLDGGIAYLDARYQDYKNANCYSRQPPAEGCISTPGGNIQDLSNHRLAYAPEWEIIAGGQYRFVGENVDSFIQANWRAQTEIYLDAAGSPEAVQPGYGIFDLSLGASSKNQRYNGKLFINNLFDKQYVSGARINGNAGGDLILQVLPRDFKRYLGVELTLRY